MGIRQELGLKVVAEGVEDDEQFKILKDLGCDLIQGYLLVEPASAVAVQQTLSRLA